jgi:hypothetical protein
VVPEDVIPGVTMISMVIGIAEDHATKTAVVTNVVTMGAITPIVVRKIVTVAAMIVAATAREVDAATPGCREAAIIAMSGTVPRASMARTTSAVQHTTGRQAVILAMATAIAVATVVVDKQV